MFQRAYLGLTDECEWAVFLGDGTEAESVVLAVGQPFMPGSAVREAVETLEARAQENGCRLEPPALSAPTCALLKLIQPEIMADVLGAQA